MTQELLNQYWIYLSFFKCVSDVVVAEPPLCLLAVKMIFDNYNKSVNICSHYFVYIKWKLNNKKKQKLII